jgi:metal-responsive CopG/Arc/MetJ family transcriptional regulator
MRATVTIAEELFEEADRRAKELGVSRSHLYQEALDHYLQQLRARELTERMDRHLEKHGQTIEPEFGDYVARAWAQEIGEDEW